MRVRVVVLTATMILAATGSIKGETAVWGVGAKTCGIFANNYLINPKLADDVYHSWAQGFMSGINYAKVEATGGSRDLSALPTDEQMARIKKYCNEHPLADYIDAVMDLYKGFPQNEKTKSNK
jgi:hypothetical protein